MDSSLLIVPCGPSNSPGAYCGRSKRISPISSFRTSRTSPEVLMTTSPSVPASIRSISTPPVSPMSTPSRTKLCSATAISISVPVRPRLAKRLRSAASSPFQMPLSPDMNSIALPETSEVKRASWMTIVPPARIAISPEAISALSSSAPALDK